MVDLDKNPIWYPFGTISPIAYGTRGISLARELPKQRQLVLLLGLKGIVDTLEVADVLRRNLLEERSEGVLVNVS